MTSRPRYQPIDARDVTSEVAAFGARSVNGRVTPTNTNGTGVTETLRAKLPRPADVFQTFQRGGSDALAAAVREQDAEEEARQEDKLRRAQAEYESYLASRHTGAANVIDDDANADGEAAEGEGPSYDDNFRKIKEDADKAAEAIRTSSPRTMTAAPASVPVPVQPTSTPSVVSRPISTIDIDRLWDWLRADAAGKAPHAWMFLGREYATSIDLHNAVGTIANDRERSAIRAIDVNGVHVGFFMLKPIDRASNTAMLHLYLSPMVRMQILTLAPYILSGARQIIPPTMNLATNSPREDERFARFFEQFGFRAYVMFVQFGEGQAPIAYPNR